MCTLSDSLRIASLGWNGMQFGAAKKYQLAQSMRWQKRQLAILPGSSSRSLQPGSLDCDRLDIR